MRFSSFAVFCCAALLAAPAFAGQVTYADGRGQWRPTGCPAPERPATLEADPHIAADNLNARMAAHNAFVAASQAYMDCVSQEAQRDAEAMNAIIIGSAKELIEKTNADVQKSAHLIDTRAR